MLILNYKMLELCYGMLNGIYAHTEYVWCQNHEAVLTKKANKKITCKTNPFRWVANDFRWLLHLPNILAEMHNINFKKILLYSNMSLFHFLHIPQVSIFKSI